MAHECVAYHCAKLSASDIHHGQLFLHNFTICFLDEFVNVGGWGAPFLHRELNFGVLSDAVLESFGKGRADQL